MATESWLKCIQNAKKTTIIRNGHRKVHFLMEGGKEMVEEYNIHTNVLVRRAWKVKKDFTENADWIVEVGNPESIPGSIDAFGIQESSNTPFITRRITRKSLEWRIRNLPYPISVYSVTAEDDNTITIRTSNKKYFKKIKVPDLERINLKPEQDKISYIHQYNTLIITYKKPPALLDLEKQILKEILSLKPINEEEVQCPIN